jgi:hypothetical protein
LKEKCSSINLQGEEVAQHHSFEYGNVEIGWNVVEIAFPDENVEEYLIYHYFSQRQRHLQLNGSLIENG